MILFDYWQKIIVLLKITASALEKFRPIVNKSITTAITDLTQESLVDEANEEKSKVIITTDEELKAFEMTKELLLKLIRIFPMLIIRTL